MSEENMHKHVIQYDGAFKCLTCNAEWGWLPGSPIMPDHCVSKEQVLQARIEELEAQVVKKDAALKIARACVLSAEECTSHADELAPCEHCIDKHVATQAINKAISPEPPRDWFKVDEETIKRIMLKIVYHTPPIDAMPARKAGDSVTSIIREELGGGK